MEGWGLGGGGCSITDACLFHSENIGRRRGIKVLRGYPSFLICIEQHVFRWGHHNLLRQPVGSWFSFLQAHGPAAASPSGPFCCGVEADGECGQCSCRLFSSQSVHSSKIQEGLHRGRQPLSTCLLPNNTTLLFLGRVCLGYRGINAPSQ